MSGIGERHIHAGRPDHLSNTPVVCCDHDAIAQPNLGHPSSDPAHEGHAGKATEGFFRESGGTDTGRNHTQDAHSPR